jgi:hypothetical protein
VVIGGQSTDTVACVVNVVVWVGARVVVRVEEPGISAEVVAVVVGGTVAGELELDVVLMLEGVGDRVGVVPLHDNVSNANREHPSIHFVGPYSFFIGSTSVPEDPFHVAPMRIHRILRSCSPKSCMMTGQTTKESPMTRKGPCRQV